LSASSLTSRLTDGPLKGLLPAIADYHESSSAESATGLDPNSLRITGTPNNALATSPVGRRIVSDPLATFGSSPRSPLGFHSSYLNEANHTLSHHSVSPRRRSAQFPHPSTSSPTSFSPYHNHNHNHNLNHHLSPSPTHSRRRRSLTLSGGSAGATLGASPVRAGALVGSYEHSLLAGRLSALPSMPLPFLGSLAVLGAPDSPARLRCPAHLTAHFDAHFYDPSPSASPVTCSPLAKSLGSRDSSPWVGSIDLEHIYRAQLADPATRHLPRFPGYRVPPVGQVQLVIRNHAPETGHSALKLFLVPYDVRGLERGGLGGKTFVRQKSYALDADGHQGRLRYAVHLQFCSPPPPTRGKGKGKAKEAAPEAAYYVYSTIRVVFGSKARDATEALRVVAEGPQGVIDLDAPRAANFASFSGATLEWDKARRVAKVARAGRVQGALSEGGEGEGEAMELDPAAPLGMDSLGRALMGLAEMNKPRLEFARRLSQVDDATEGRAGLGALAIAGRWTPPQGGLSISRPASRQDGAD